MCTQGQLEYYLYQMRFNFNLMKKVKTKTDLNLISQGTQPFPTIRLALFGLAWWAGSKVAGVALCSWNEACLSKHERFVGRVSYPVSLPVWCSRQFHIIFIDHTWLRRRGDTNFVLVFLCKKTFKRLFKLGIEQIHEGQPWPKITQGDLHVQR